MPDLILRPSGNPDRPWSLQLRWHGLSGTAYQTLWTGSEDAARDIVMAGKTTWLFGTPEAIEEATNDG